MDGLNKKRELKARDKGDKKHSAPVSKNQEGSVSFNSKPREKGKKKNVGDKRGPPKKFTNSKDKNNKNASPYQNRDGKAGKVNEEKESALDKTHSQARRQK